MSFDSLFTSTQPRIAVRGMHLDLKGLPPTVDRLLRLLELAAAARYNAVLVEWEDMFPWTVDQRFRSPTAYNSTDVARFHFAAARLGIEVIPLVQSLGHAQTPLSIGDYSHLRQRPNSAAMFDPLNPDSGKLVQRMVLDVLGQMPQPRWFHLGGDEAWSLAATPQSREFIAAHGEGSLYLRHVGPILELLIARGIRPILWHDMMVRGQWDDGSLRELAGKADLMAWGYGAGPDVPGLHCNRNELDRLRDQGLTLWAAGAYKGADGVSSDVPDYAARQSNAQTWMAMAPRYDFQGIIATGWSRYSTHRIQCDPIEGAIDSLVNLAIIFHDGDVPKGERKAVLDALDKIGEHEHFKAVRKSLMDMGNGRNAAWQMIRELREQHAIEGADSRRGESGVASSLFLELTRCAYRLKEVGARLEELTNQSIQPHWIKRYVRERVDPIREEIEMLSR